MSKEKRSASDMDKLEMYVAELLAYTIPHGPPPPPPKLIMRTGALFRRHETELSKARTRLWAMFAECRECKKETRTGTDFALASFAAMFHTVSEVIHQRIRAKGFWHARDAMEGAGFGTHARIAAHALIATEVSESVEAIRNGNPPDDKVPDFQGDAAELADTIIRIMDYAAGYGVPVGEALIAKIEMNQGRHHMHGKSA